MNTPINQGPESNEPESEAVRVSEITADLEQFETAGNVPPSRPAEPVIIEWHDGSNGFSL